MLNRPADNSAAGLRGSFAAPVRDEAENRVKEQVLGDRLLRKMPVHEEHNRMPRERKRNYREGKGKSLLGRGPAIIRTW